MPDEPKVAVVGEEEKDVSQEKVDVTPAVTAGTAEDQLVEKIKADFEALYGSRIKQVESQFENFRHGAYRIQDDLKKEVERLKSAQGTASLGAEGVQRSLQDPWAGIENGPQWKVEIEKLAEQKATQKLQEWQAQQHLQTMTAQQEAARQLSKQAVIERYPDLDPETGDPTTLISKAYVSAINEHPDWLSNPYGPQLAMYAMEENLKAQAANGAVPRGEAGRSRVGASALPPSRPTTASGERLTLTREQKAFCDRHAIKYEDYVKTATALEQGVVEA